MSLLMNPPVNTAAESEDLTSELASMSNDDASDELTIVQRSKFTDPSAMPAHLKEKVQSENPSVKALFEQMMDANEASSENLNWIDDQVVEANGFSKRDLHSFILKAESLGKNITYTKQTIISISN